MKILVSLHVPAVSATYDVMIPDTLRIKSAVTLIANTVETLSNQSYVASGMECLCSVEKNIMLRNGATLQKYGIQNGDHLILM